jgi:hypothetical protein
MIIRLLLRSPAMYPRLTQNVDAKDHGLIEETETGYVVGPVEDRHHIPFANVIEAITVDPAELQKEIDERMEGVRRAFAELGKPLKLAEAPETFVPPGIVSQAARDAGMDPYCIPSPPEVDNPHVESVCDGIVDAVAAKKPGRKPKK